MIMPLDGVTKNYWILKKKKRNTGYKPTKFENIMLSEIA